MLSATLADLLAQLGILWAAGGLLVVALCALELAHDWIQERRALRAEWEAAERLRRVTRLGLSARTERLDLAELERRASSRRK